MKDGLLEEGDIIEINKTHTVYADVPEHFIFDNRKGIFDLTHGTINIKDLDYLAGKYIVYKTCSDGGGTGHGAHDSYGNGYHVFCEREDCKYKIDFYQTGDFTAVIKTIIPIGKAVKQWVAL